MLLHIPHASVEMPTVYRNLPAAEINQNTDWFTDELFDFPAPKFVFPFSRYYVDVERLRNDPLEAKGRGIAYTHTSSGIEYRKVDDALKSEIHTIHDRWLADLKREADKQSSLLDNVVVVDCHSFSAEQVDMEDHHLPDICIGYNYDSSRLPDEIVDGIAKIFNLYGFSVAANYPYGNAIKVTDTPNVFSVMIEVNKRVYLDNDYTMTKDAHKISAAINTALKYIQDFETGVVFI